MGIRQTLGDGLPVVGKAKKPMQNEYRCAGAEFPGEELRGICHWVIVGLWGQGRRLKI
jgi:hypothetical protein